MDSNVDLINEWFNEPIDKLKSGNWLYRFVCFFLFKKKLTYKEMYLMLYGINRKKLGETKSKEKAMLRIIQIYKDLHNNNLPKGVKL